MDSSSSDEDSSPFPSSSLDESPVSVEVVVRNRGVRVPLHRKTQPPKNETPTCPECGLLFSKPGNRNKHIRAVHGIEPELKSVDSIEKECLDCGILFPSTSLYHKHRKEEHGTVHCCVPGCNWRGSSHKGLGRHAAERHATQGKTFQWEKKQFESGDQFNQFIREMYGKGHMWYIRNGSNSGTVEKVDYRYCYREDRKGRQEKKRPVKRGRKRRNMKEVQVEKIPIERSEACCTSYMRVKWKVDGSVLAEYCIDHLAHDLEVTSLPLLQEHKDEIREMLKTEDDPERIVSLLREKYEGEGGRLASLKEGEVRDIMMEEVDPFGDIRLEWKEENGDGMENNGGTACITMEFSPSPSCEEGGDTSSLLLALLDEHRDGSNMTLGGLVSTAQSNTPGTTTKKKQPRFKLTDNGFVFRFDKNSVCGERQFWRCEKKAECAARIHTDMKGTIVKRINYHTHPATSNPDEVHLPKKKARTSSSDPLSFSIAPENNAYPSKEGQPSGEMHGEFPQLIDGGMHGLLDSFVKEEDTVNFSHPMLDGEDVHARPAEIAPLMRNPIDRSELGMDDEFWKVFNLSKKVYAIVKKEVEKNAHLNGCLEFVDGEVEAFLNYHHFIEFAPKLHRYNRTEMLRLSVDEWTEVLENVAEGVRMYHSIRTEWGELAECEQARKKKGPSLPSIKVYVSPADEGNPIYKLVNLPEGRRNMQSLREGLIRRGVFTEEENPTLCLNEDGLTVELCDEVLEEWTANRLFLVYRRSGDYLIFEPAQKPT